MCAELMLLVSICAQEAAPQGELPAATAPAHAAFNRENAAAAPMPEEALEDAPPSTQAQLAEIESLMDVLFAEPVPSSWRSDATYSPAADNQPVKNTMIVSLQPLAKVTSDYIRLIDVAEFVEDPEGLAPFLGTIVVGPAPELEKIAIVSRSNVAQRIEEYGLALDQFLLTGAPQVFVARVKAAHEDKKEAARPDSPAATHVPETPPATHLPQTPPPTYMPEGCLTPETSHTK